MIRILLADDHTLMHKGISPAHLQNIVVHQKVLDDAGSSLTRLGHEQYLYVAMSAGVALMF
jgi:hypothetical protein